MTEREKSIHGLYLFTTTFSFVNKAAAATKRKIMKKCFKIYYNENRIKQKIVYV